VKLNESLDFQEGLKGNKNNNYLDKYKRLSYFPFSFFILDFIQQKLKHCLSGVVMYVDVLCVTVLT
jgi:hypothetical protein